MSTSCKHPHGTRSRPERIRDDEHPGGIGLAAQVGPSPPGGQSCSCAPNVLRRLPNLGMWWSLEHMDVLNCGGGLELQGHGALPRTRTLLTVLCPSVPALQATPLFVALMERASTLVRMCGCERESDCPSSVQLTDCGKYIGFGARPVRGSCPRPCWRPRPSTGDGLGGGRCGAVIRAGLGCILWGLHCDCPLCMRVCDVAGAGVSN